jgi:hypothetical protein
MAIPAEFPFSKKVRDFRNSGNTTPRLGEGIMADL